MSADANRIRRAIFARCRAAGMDAAERHEVQRRATGKASLTQMTLVEMQAVLKALGGTVRSGDLPAGPHTAKLRALWISAYWLGVVRDRSDAVLAAWIRRQAGIEAARWATPAHTAACVEALKDWLARDAGVDWSPYAMATGEKPFVHIPGARVAEALWRKLHVAGAVRVAEPGALRAWVAGDRGDVACYTTFDASTLARLHQRLGVWLRRVSG